MSSANILNSVNFKISQLLGRRTTTGRTIFVHSSGSANSNGREALNPVNTIDNAIGLCTAAKGDTIVVMPGHTEAISAAGGIASDVAGVNIIGMGTGRNRPKVTWGTSTAATWAVSAANTFIDNIVMDMTGVDAVVSGLAISAADCTISNCEIEVANSSGQATLGILTTAAADRLKIIGNHIFGSADAGTATAIRIVGGNDHIIKGNFINGAFTTTLGGIQNVTTACLRVHIDGNTIINRTASSTVAITMVATSTGAITNNRMSVLTGTAPIVAAAIEHVGGNYYTAAAGVTAGTLI